MRRSRKRITLYMGLDHPCGHATWIKRRELPNSSKPGTHGLIRHRSFSTNCRLEASSKAAWAKSTARKRSTTTWKRSLLWLHESPAANKESAYGFSRLSRRGRYRDHRVKQPSGKCVHVGKLEAAGRRDRESAFR